ncbi:MAG: DUF192 domain-containing protein [Candidatus Binatia bacterium]
MLLLALGAACRESRPAVVLTPKGGAPVTVYVEIADNPDLQARGLMYRTHLDPDRGMLFLFDHDKNHFFWMKNTAIPLDMIFVSHDGRIVGIQANTEPFSLRPVGPGIPSRDVLEVNAGFAAAHGLAAGDTVTYRNVAASRALSPPVEKLSPLE